MHSTVKKIGIILLAVVLLPLITFTVIELNTLGESEIMLENIYKNQLDAILFSVNQYTEDVVNGWKRKINAGLPDSIKPAYISQGAIVYIMYADTSREISLNFEGEEPVPPELRESVTNALNKNQAVIERLFTYKTEGYSKNEPIQITGTGYSLLVFVPEEKTGQFELAGFVIDPQTFVRRILAPRLREVAREEFNLAVFEKNTQNMVFSVSEPEDQNFEQKKPFWILPGYELGITLANADMSDYVKARSLTNIIILSILNLVVIGGLAFVFRSVKKEVEVAQVKSDFVSNVSHELRTPLALISMFAETLELGRVKSEEKKQEYYGIISAEAGRLSQMVNKILNFSKMESGKKVYNFEKTNLKDISAQVMETYSFHLEEKGFAYSFEDKGAQPARLDREAIQEALINLIDNAVKYSEENKEIKITTGLEDSYSYLEVTDKGVGISEHDRKKIFDKFYRVSSGLVHNTKGTGLGLSLVKHIVDAHNGKIELNSSPGKGSSFRLLFPAERGE